MTQSNVRILTIFYLGAVFFLPCVSIGATQSYAEVAEECRQRGPELDRAGLIRYWTEPANAGDAKAQLCLGVAIKPPQAWIGPADPDVWAEDARVAVEWIRRSAEQGFAPAQEALADAYARGSLTHDGVSQDLGKARDWMEKAANQGSPWAHISLGQWYLRGNEAVPVDRQRGYQHLLLGVELLRAYKDPAEFRNMMAYFGLEEEVKRLAGELTAEDQAKAESWVKSQLQKFTKP
jgi:TPR repeat protein